MRRGGPGVGGADPAVPRDEGGITEASQPGGGVCEPGTEALGKPTLTSALSKFTGLEDPRHSSRRVGDSRWEVTPVADCL